MSALVRRLGNLTKPFYATATLRSLSTETSLQTLVDDFKKSSEDKKFRRKRDNYIRHVRLLAEASQFDMIKDTIEHQKKFPDIRNEGFIVRLIYLYGESGMFEHARKLFDEMPALGCPRTVKSLNALLKSGITAKEFHRVVEAFEVLPSSVSIEPDIFSHNTVIHALCEMGSLDEALSKLREMGEKADIVTYNTLLSALYKTGRFSDAENLWAEMEVEPDARSYDIRIKGMFSEKKVDEAIELAGEMAKEGFGHDKYSYNTLIVGLCGNGRFEEAMKCYDDLRKSSCDRHLLGTYSALIPACCEAGEFDKAFELCLEAVKYKVSLTPELRKQVTDGIAEKGKTQG